MKKAKKLLAALFGVVILVSCMTTSVFAAETGTQDGLNAVIQTDKESYAANEDIQITVTVTNTNTFEVKDVSIESLLPDALTLKDGDLKSKTVDLKPGETLSISCVAVLEKDEPTTILPTTTEPETELPATTEPGTAQPEETTTEETTTEMTTAEPSTVPDTTIPETPSTTEQTETTTDSGAILPVEPSTVEPTTGIIEGELTTVDNTPDNPDTGSGSTIIKVLLIALAAAAVVAAIILITRKNSKKATKVISLVLCGAIAVSSFATVGLIKVGAEEGTQLSFSVDKTITVDNEEYTIQANVSYSQKSAFELVVDQSNFTTTENNVLITGHFQSNITMKSITYTVTSYSDNNSPSNTGEAIVNDSKFSFFVQLKPDWNKVTITAESESGLIVSKELTITYDSGKVYIPDKEAVRYEETISGYYVDNILVCYLKNGTAIDDINKLVNDVKGTIVGQLNSLDQYQIKVENRSFEELNMLCDSIMKNYDFVIYATYDTVYYDSSNSYVPEDPWNNDVDSNDWNDDDIDGSNWWAEAIDLQKAWDNSERFGKINVGISDSGFDTGHEDLKNRYSFPNEILKERNKNELDKFVASDKTSYHGTHVAGIIGAEANNKKGITGVAWNSHMLFAPYYPTYNDDVALQWDVSTYANLTYLVEAGAKVVNFSQGKTNFLSNIQPSYSQEFIKREGDLAAIFMSKLLDRGYDFIVVQSAGNGIGNTLLGTDALQNGWFCSITKNSITGSNKTSISDVLDRTIIVAAADETNSRNYQLTDFSNFGNQVSIVAPGKNIFSCVPGDTFTGFEFWGGYTTMNGTSMAAPIVSGVAALVWSINGSFSGSEVKHIVCNYTKDTVRPFYSNDNGIYRLVNAQSAVEEAIRRTDNTLTHAFGTVIDAETGLPLEATVEVSRLGETIERKTNPQDGSFSFELEPGEYTIRITSPGYQFIYTTFNVPSGTDYQFLGEFNMTRLSEQTPRIGGYVKDKETDQYLSGVTVTAYDENRTQIVGTAVTDNNGSYEVAIEKFGTYDLVFNKDGYSEYVLDNVRAEYNGLNGVDPVYLTPVNVSYNEVDMYSPYADEQFTAYLLEGRLLTISGNDDKYQYQGYGLIGKDGSYCVAKVNPETLNFGIANEDATAYIDLAGKPDGTYIFYFAYQEGNTIKTYSSLPIILEIKNGIASFVTTQSYSINKEAMQKLQKSNPDTYLELDPRLVSSQDLAEIRKFTLQITSEESSDIEKAREIYNWVCNNISYDSNSSDGTVFSQTPLKVLNRRTAICDGYSQLIQAMLVSIDIPCAFISGFSPDSGMDYLPDDSSCFNNSPNHSWNVAYLDNRWVLIDGTFGAQSSGPAGWFDTDLKSFSIIHRYSQFDHPTA